MYYASYKRYWEPSTAGALTIGTIAGGIATAVTHPFDYFRTKVQVRAEGIGMRQKSLEMGVNFFHVFRQFQARGYGFSHIFTGFQSAMAARMSFLFSRNLVYKVIYDAKKPKKVTNDLTHKEKMAISGFAGAIGAIASNPFEIIKIRQISDLGRPANFQHGHGALGEAFTALGTEKAGIWRGVGANITRAVLLGTVMIYPYDRVKEHMYNAFGDVFVNPIGALLVASVIGTVVTLPIDNIRTRLMNQFPDKSLNRMNYTGIISVINKATKVEGANALFVGMVPHFLHVLLYSALTLYVSDFIVTANKRAAGLPEHQI